MKYYIVGTGGIGGYFGGLMAKAGLDVTFVARGKNYKALSEKGLQVKSTFYESFYLPEVQVVSEISQIKNPDVIIFSVKTYDTEKVAEELKKIVKCNTKIITFQNGIDNDLKIRSFLPEINVYPGVAYIIVKKSNPGEIKQTGKMRKLIFGARNAKGNSELNEFFSDLKKTGIDVTLSEDIMQEIWNKYIYIIAFAGATAYFRASIGEILKDKEKLKVFINLLKEAIIVANKKGIRLQDDIFDMKMKIAENSAPDSKSSLLIDIENHRKTEIETLHGDLIRFSQEVNTEVPTTQMVFQKLQNI